MADQQITESEITDKILVNSKFLNDNYLNYQYTPIPFETFIVPVAGTAVAQDVNFSSGLKDLLLIDTLRAYVVNNTTNTVKAEDPLYVTVKVEIGSTNFRAPIFPSQISLWRLYDIMGIATFPREKYDLKTPWVVPPGSQITVTFTTAGAGLTAGNTYMCGLVMCGIKLGNELLDKLLNLPKVI